MKCIRGVSRTWLFKTRSHKNLKKSKFKSRTKTELENTTFKTLNRYSAEKWLSYKKTWKQRKMKG